MMMILTTYKEKRMKRTSRKKKEVSNAFLYIYICMQTYNGAVHPSKEGNKSIKMIGERKDTIIFLCIRVK